MNEFKANINEYFEWIFSKSQYTKTGVFVAFPLKLIIGILLTPCVIFMCAISYFIIEYILESIIKFFIIITNFINYIINFIYNIIYK